MTTTTIVTVAMAGAYDVERLRACPLSFLEPVIEPGSARAWIERGGVG